MHALYAGLGVAIISIGASCGNVTRSRDASNEKVVDADIVDSTIADDASAPDARPTFTFTILAESATEASFVQEDAALGTDFRLGDVTLHGTAGFLLPLSSAGDGFWRYRRSISVSGAGPASPLADYPVLVTVDTGALIAAGKLQSTAGDLRFTDASGTELPWWIESGLDTAGTRIWVKTTSIPIGGTTIHLYYGNPAAALTGGFAHAGTSVFEWFDDFDGPALDPARWELSEVDPRLVLPSLVGESCVLDSDGGAELSLVGMQTATTFSGDHAFDFDMSVYWSTPYSNLWLTSVNTYPDLSLLAQRNSGYWSAGANGSAMQGAWQGHVQVLASTGTISFLEGDTLQQTTSVPPFTSPYLFTIAAESGPWSGMPCSVVLTLNDFRVRPLVSPEPSTMPPGPEEPGADAVYPASRSYFVHTTDANQMAPVGGRAIDSVTTATLEPAGTSVRALVSFDGRTTWRRWNGSSWTVATTMPTAAELHAALVTDGMPTVELDAALAGYAFLADDSALDFAFDLRTTDPANTPSLSSVIVTYH